MPSPTKTPPRPTSARPGSATKRSPHSPATPGARPQSAGTRGRTEIYLREDGATASAFRPKSPLRKPVSAIGKAMKGHLDELWDHDTTTHAGLGETRRLSGSPTRKARRAELELKSAIEERAREVERQCFSVIHAHTHPVRSICLGPTYTYSASMDGLIKVWQFEEMLDVQGRRGPAGVPVQVLKAHSAGVSSLCVVDDRVLVTYLFSKP